MTTTNCMNNFKHLAEQMAMGGKLLTTQEKVIIMAHRFHGCESNSATLLKSNHAQFSRLRLVGHC